MKTTDNLKLNSPELSDAANVLKISENFEKLDKLFETLSVKKSKTAVSEFNSKCCMPYIRFINESEEDITVTDSSAEEETTFTVKAGESYVEWISEASVTPDYSFSAALDVNYFVLVADAIGSGGGGGGTSDYAELSNKPKINNVELSGNKSLSDIGAGTYSKPTTGIPKTDLSEAVQLSLGRADTALQTEAHTGDYSKPAGGIPKTDLAEAVQNSLSLADTALQTEQYKGTYSKPTGGIPKSDLANDIQNSLGLADTALQKHQSLEGYVLTTDSRLSDATTSASGLMSASDKTKLNGIASGATANTGTVTSVKVEGSNGLSGSGTVTTTGTITLSNSGVRSITQDSTDGHKLTINTGGTSTTITIPDNNTTYSSKSAASGGTDVSLCTTGEKYTWNNSVPMLSTADGADYNDFVYTGFYETMGTSSKPTSNSPNGNDTNNDFYVIVQRRGNGYCSQLAISARSDRGIYIRVYDNGTFGDWHKIALKSEIPTKISQLTNDSGYQTALKTVDFKSQSLPSSMSFDSCTFDFAKCVYNSHMVSISIKVSAIHVKDSAKNQNWGNITTLSTIASDIPKPPTSIYGTAYQTGNSTPIYFTIDVSGTLFFITPTSTISNIAESSIIVGSLNYLV